MVFFKEHPPITLIYKSLPTQAQTIAMAIHIHAQEWLTMMFRVSRRSLAQPRKTKKHATHNNN